MADSGYSKYNGDVPAGGIEFAGGRAVEWTRRWRVGEMHGRTAQAHYYGALRERGNVMQLTSGSRLQSCVCDTEVVVIKAPAIAIDLQCGGAPMIKIGSGDRPTGSPKSGQDQGTDLGKRYADEDSGLELLCTKSGKGTLSISGVLLDEKKSKPLPSSD